jgi:hypothetical protein
MITVLCSGFGPRLSIEEVIRSGGGINSSEFQTKVDSASGNPLDGEGVSCAKLSESYQSQLVSEASPVDMIAYLGQDTASNAKPDFWLFLCTNSIESEGQISIMVLIIIVCFC